MYKMAVGVYVCDYHARGAKDKIKGWTSKGPNTEDEDIPECSFEGCGNAAKEIVSGAAEITVPGNIWMLGRVCGRHAAQIKKEAGKDKWASEAHDEGSDCDVDDCSSAAAEDMILLADFR